MVYQAAGSGNGQRECISAQVTANADGSGKAVFSGEKYTYTITSTGQTYAWKRKIHATGDTESASGVAKLGGNAVMFCDSTTDNLHAALALSDRLQSASFDDLKGKSFKHYKCSSLTAPMTTTYDPQGNMTEGTETATAADVQKALSSDGVVFDAGKPSEERVVRVFAVKYNDSQIALAVSSKKPGQERYALSLLVQE